MIWRSKISNDKYGCNFVKLFHCYDHLHCCQCHDLFCSKKLRYSYCAFLIGFNLWPCLQNATTHKKIPEDEPNTFSLWNSFKESQRSSVTRWKLKLTWLERANCVWPWLWRCSFLLCLSVWLLLKIPCTIWDPTKAHIKNK